MNAYFPAKLAGKLKMINNNEFQFKIACRARTNTLFICLPLVPNAQIVFFNRLPQACTASKRLSSDWCENFPSGSSVLQWTGKLSRAAAVRRLPTTLHSNDDVHTATLWPPGFNRWVAAQRCVSFSARRFGSTWAVFTLQAATHAERRVVRVRTPRASQASIHSPDLTHSWKWGAGRYPRRSGRPADHAGTCTRSCQNFWLSATSATCEMIGIGYVSWDITAYQWRAPIDRAASSRNRRKGLRNCASACRRFRKETEPFQCQVSPL